MATRKQRLASASPSSNRGMATWLGLATIIVLLDQLSKVTVTRLISHGDSRPVTSFFNVVLAYNEGAAFSFLAGQGGWQRWLFAGIAAAAVVFILYLLKRNPGQQMFSCALSLILGGAAGNLIDRMVYGHVIDFLDVHVGGWHWPAFNVADAAICVGAALFIIDELRRVNR